MHWIDNITLKTNRLWIRPYTKQDADTFFNIVSQVEVAKTLSELPHPYPKEWAQRWIRLARKNLAKGLSYDFGLFLADSSILVGNASLTQVSKVHQKAKLFYFIDPLYWNQGYATEACCRLLQFGFEDLGLERISGSCMAKNTRSKKVLEKAGLTYEGLSRHAVYRWGAFEDVLRFGILRSDWYNALE